MKLPILRDQIFIEGVHLNNAWNLDCGRDVARVRRLELRYSSHHQAASSFRNFSAESHRQQVFVLEETGKL
jgi:hypothetical protein